VVVVSDGSGGGGGGDAWREKRMWLSKSGNVPRTPEAGGAPSVFNNAGAGVCKEAYVLV